MPTIDLGRVKGDTGVSMRSKGSWTPSTTYVNNSQYIDIVTNGGNSYACKTSHTSGSTFSSDNWNLVAQKGAKGDKGDKGNTPTIQAGTVTHLASTAAPTVTATTSGTTTTFNFGIPKGDTSKIETPTFTDTVSTYTTLDAANTAAETASNAIKSKVSIFITLSNMKKSLSAIVQGLKILATNVGAIRGITSDINSESTAIAASSKMVHDVNTRFGNYLEKSYIFGGRTYASRNQDQPRLAGRFISLPAQFTNTDINNYFVSISIQSEADTIMDCFTQKITGGFNVFFRYRDGHTFEDQYAVWFDYTVLINH